VDVVALLRVAHPDSHGWHGMCGQPVVHEVAGTDVPNFGAVSDGLGQCAQRADASGCGVVIRGPTEPVPLDDIGGGVNVYCGLLT
jgi:hypothetical protein